MSAATKAQELYYKRGETELAAGNTEKAADLFKQAGSYKDAADKVKAAYYSLGVAALNDKNYDKAAEYLKLAGDYKDAAAKGKEAYYNKGVALLNDKDYAGATEYLKLAGNYKNAKTLLTETAYGQGIDALAKGSYATAKTFFQACGKYKFAADLINACDGEEKLAAGNLADAWTSYSKVSKKAKVTGFDIQARKTYCNAKNNFSKVNGTWNATSNNCYVKNITKYSFGRYTRKYYLKNLQQGQYITINYSENGDGTFNMSVSVTYVRFASPSLFGAKYYTESKDLTNIKSFPSTVKFSSGAKITFKSNKYVLTYSKNTKSGRVKNQYRSTITYKKQ